MVSVAMEVLETEHVDTWLKFMVTTMVIKTLNFVVDVGGSLRRYLLNYVHRGAIVGANTLIVTTDHAVRSPQRKNNVAAV